MLGGVVGFLETNKSGSLQVAGAPCQRLWPAAGTMVIRSRVAIAKRRFHPMSLFLSNRIEQAGPDSWPPVSSCPCLVAGT